MSGTTEAFARIKIHALLNDVGWNLADGSSELFNQQAQPIPAVPAPYRPGTLTVRTKVAQRRKECVFPGGIEYLPILRFTGFSLKCSVSPRPE